MPLSSVVTLVRDRLAAASIADLPPVDAVGPAVAADVPRVTVSVADAVTGFRGMGGVPAPPQSGALRVEVVVDLADPILHLPGEDVPLLSANRRVLQLPHGGVVRADGDAAPPFALADLLVRRNATVFTPVHQAPSAGEVQLDITAGTLSFPSPLPATGTLDLSYFVGLWEVRVERFAATVIVDIAHDDPDDHASLTESIEAALRADQWPAEAGMRSIEPLALSSATSIPGLPAANRTRRLTYRCDVERIEPAISTSGGPIRIVQVPITLEQRTSETSALTETEEMTIRNGVTPP